LEVNRSNQVNKSDDDVALWRSSRSESSVGKDNKDLLGMLYDEEANQTDFMCEE